MRRFELESRPDGYFTFFAATLTLVGDLLDSLTHHFLYEGQAGSEVICTNLRIDYMLLGLKQVHAQIFQLAFGLLLWSRSVMCNQVCKQSQHDSVPCVWLFFADVYAHCVFAIY